MDAYGFALNLQRPRTEVSNENNEVETYPARVFNTYAVETFLKNHNLRLILRAHEEKRLMSYDFFLQQLLWGR